MSLSYSKYHCKNCKKDQSGVISTVQSWILLLLLTLAIIPGVIYYFLAKPNRCKICGLKIKDQKD